MIVTKNPTHFGDHKIYFSFMVDLATLPKLHIIFHSVEKLELELQSKFFVQ